MGSVCAEQQRHHKFHHSHQLNLKHKMLREIDIPPRRQQQQFSRRQFHDSDHLLIDSELHKFLPSNTDGDSDDEDSDPYSSDHFRMFEFKVRKCTRSRSHDWTDCPFAHPGEKARRRDPRRYHYAGTVCPEFRRGNCGRGENCEFSHGVFECWLHPSRYRTEACKDGKNCKRKICFFAHTPRQLRVLPVTNSGNDSVSIPLPPPPSSSGGAAAAANSSYFKPCCVYCHSLAAANSPTSTLLGMSHVSPPLSPSPPRSPARFSSPGCRYKKPEKFSDPGGILLQFNSGAISYKEAVNELMNSMEAMQLNNHHHQQQQQHQEPISSPRPWVDVMNNFNTSEDQFPNQFIMSPSNLSPAAGCGTSKFGAGFVEESAENINGGGGLGGLDLGWVNDLLT